MIFWETVVVAVLGGVVGGLISHGLAIRRFQNQHLVKIVSEAKLNRLHVLRDCLTQSYTVWEGLHQGWESVGEQRMSKARDVLRAGGTLFQAESDIDEAIGVFETSIGETWESLSDQYSDAHLNMYDAEKLLSERIARFETELGVYNES